MKKHLIAWGILSTMFMANTFAQKDIDRPIMGLEFMEHLSCKYQ